jgi:hypothetical protein
MKMILVFNTKSGEIFSLSATVYITTRIVIGWVDVLRIILLRQSVKYRFKESL